MSTILFFYYLIKESRINEKATVQSASNSTDSGTSKRFAIMIKKNKIIYKIRKVIYKKIKERKC